MKQTLCIIILIGLVQSINAQKLSIKLSSYSDPIEVGNKIKYDLYLTNDTEADMLMFNSPRSDFKVGGYKYTVSFNGAEIFSAKTRGLDTNEGFSEKSVSTLAAGETKSLLGLTKFPIDNAGKYEIHITYYQDPSTMVEDWAVNKKAIKAVKKITPFKVELNETLVVE